MRFLRDRQGVTLVELLVGMAVGGIVVMAVVGIQIMSMRSDVGIRDRDDRIEGVRNGLDHMTDEIRICSAPQALTDITPHAGASGTYYTGTPVSAETSGAGLQMTCGAETILYTVADGVARRQVGTDASATVTTLATAVDHIDFTVHSAGLVSMVAHSQPVQGNEVTVPAAALPRLATAGNGGGGSGDNGGGGDTQTCGAASQAVYQKQFYINSSVTLKGQAQVWGDLFVNGDLGAQGQAHVTNTGWATGNVQASKVGTAMPDQASLNFPQVDWDALKTAAQQPPNTYVSGNANLSSNPTFAQPTIYFVEGNLTLSGQKRVTVSGTVTFVVLGKVNLSGQAMLIPADPNSAIAIWSKNEVSVTGQAQLQSLVFTEDKLFISGQGKVTGVVAAQSMEANGQAVLYDDSSVLNTSFPGDTNMCTTP